jgi:hypothetical protein
MRSANDVLEGGSFVSLAPLYFDQTDSASYSDSHFNAWNVLVVVRIELRLHSTSLSGTIGSIVAQSAPACEGSGYFCIILGTDLCAPPRSHLTYRGVSRSALSTANSSLLGPLSLLKSVLSKPQVRSFENHCAAGIG